MHPVASAPSLRKKRIKCSAAPCCITSNIIVQLDRCSRSSGLSAPSSALLGIFCSFTAGFLIAAAPTRTAIPYLLKQYFIPYLPYPPLPPVARHSLPPLFSHMFLLLQKQQSAHGRLPYL